MTRKTNALIVGIAMAISSPVFADENLVNVQQVIARPAKANLRNCATNYHLALTEECLQIRTVEASERTLWWTGLAATLGGINLTLVLVALWFAGRANLIAQDTARRQLRAYLFTDRVTVNPAMLSGTSKLCGWTIGPYWSNCGQTPATNVKIRSILKVTEEKVPKFDISEELITKFNIGPSGGQTAIALPIYVHQCLAIRSGSHYGFIYTEAIYDDCFGNTHKEVNCYKINFVGKPDIYTPDTDLPVEVLRLTNTNKYEVFGAA